MAILYRQAVELSLKAIVGMANKILETLPDNLQGLALMLEDLYDGACESLAEADYD